ncbi:MAG: RNA polymerase sigma factor, partial [Flavobacteriaceae bacterium]
VDAYQERLYWHIRRLVLNHDDADDVVQNTFVKIFQNINGFKGESQLYSWMYRIATNEALNFIKSNAKKQTISSQDYLNLKVEQLQSDVYFDGDEMEIKLQQALAQLPEKQRLVFQMKYFDDLKYEDISEILGTSIGALKANYHHAVTKIKDFLTED